MRTFGTLTLGGDRRNKRWVVTGSLPVMYLNRLVPDASILRSNVCNLSDNLTNVETIDWLMVRFPLEIDENIQAYWYERVDAVNESKKLREALEVLEPANPSGQFIGTLREFQKEGLDFLLKTQGCALLADEMGLGKGVEALAYLATAENVLPVAIIAPLVTLPHWGREINRFLRINGRKALVEVIRTGKREGLPDADIYLTNYDMLAKRGEDVRDRVRTVIFDEIQALRHMDTIRYRAAVELIGGSFVKQVLGLSGTPIHNTGAEIWPIANLIRPGLLGTYHEFVAQHCDVIWGKVQARNPQALYELLRQDLMLRRHKIDVLTELPPKLRVKEYIEADLDLYEREVSVILQKLDDKLATAKTEFERTAFKQHVLTQERQVAAICKIPYVVKWVRACLESEQPIIVYFHHLIVLDALRRYLGDWKPSVVVGGQSDWERDQEIQNFQEGKTRLLLSGIRAGSLGINLTASSFVIFAELDWTPAVHLQAEDRCIVAGQLVHVNTKGFVPIEHVEIGDEVLTSRGAWRRVTAKARRLHRGLVTRIEYTRWSHPLVCTHDHHILVKRKGANNAAWLPAHRVLPGDCLVMPRLPEGKKLSSITFPSELRHRPMQRGPYGGVFVNGRYARLPDRIEVDDDLLYLFGWYLAEGCTCTEGKKGKFVSLSGHLKERPILERLARRIVKLGVNCTIYHPKQNTLELRAFSFELAAWFKAWFGHSSHTKRIPSILMNLPRSQTLTMMRGYLEGDGYKRMKQTEWPTVSSSLAAHTLLLALKCGRAPTMRQIMSGHNKGSWIGGYTTAGNPSNKNLSSWNRRFVYHPVNKVETFFAPRHSQKTVVYDLTVDGNDPSFVVGQAVVHNCHRIGQEKQVLAYYLVAQGTLDEKVAEVLVDKTEQISTVLGDVPEGENTEEALQALEALRQLPAFRKVPVPSAGEPVIRHPVEPHPALPPRESPRTRKQY